MMFLKMSSNLVYVYIHIIKIEIYTKNYLNNNTKYVATYLIQFY